MAMTDWQKDQIRKLYSEGYSAGLIAQQLEGPTRNAVIGYIHREGLTASTEQKQRKLRAAPSGRRRSKPRDPTVRSPESIAFLPELARRGPRKKVATAYMPRVKTPEPTKEELRRQIAEAVRNTAAMQKGVLYAQQEQEQEQLVQPEVTESLLPTQTLSQEPLGALFGGVSELESL